MSKLTMGPAPFIPKRLPQQPALTDRQREAVLAYVRAVQASQEAREALADLRDAIAPLTDADWSGILCDKTHAQAAAVGGIHALDAVVCGLTADCDHAILELSGFHPKLNPRGLALMRELVLNGKPTTIRAVAN